MPPGLLAVERASLTFDLFGELDTVGVCEGAGLLVDVVDVQDLAHELDDRLGLVEGRGGHWQRTQEGAGLTVWSDA